MSQLFASGGQRIGVSASISVLPMNKPGLISFRIDWLDLLEVQGTLKSLLQHHSSKASILRHSAFVYVYIYVCITVSFCYTEGKKTLGNIVDQLYFNLKKKDKIID